MNLTYAYIIGLALPRPETVPTWMCDLGDILESSLGQSISVRTGFPSLFCACVCITFPAGMMLLRCTPETVPAAGSREGDEDPFIMSCI